MEEIKCPKCGVVTAERDEDGHLIAVGEARLSFPIHEVPKIRCSCGLVNVLLNGSQ